MPEAEVSLRLAIGLIESQKVAGGLSVAIDGAQIKTGSTVHFPIEQFLRDLGWRNSVCDGEWRGTYSHGGHDVGFTIHSSSGKGDVVAPLTDGRTLRAEAKKGPLLRSLSSAEYPLIREALGQLLTVEEAADRDVLVAAVPASEKFEKLAAMWRGRPLMVRAGVHIVTVDRSNNIRGLEHIGV